MRKTADIDELLAFQAEQNRHAAELDSELKDFQELESHWRTLEEVSETAGGKNLAPHLKAVSKLLHSHGLLDRARCVIDAIELPNNQLPESIDDYVCGLSDQSRRFLLTSISLAAKSLVQARELDCDGLAQFIDGKTFQQFLSNLSWYHLKVSILQDHFPAQLTEKQRNLWNVARSERDRVELSISSEISQELIERAAMQHVDSDSSNARGEASGNNQTDVADTRTDEADYDHTDEFDSITISGQNISLNQKQASVMQLLWTRAEGGHPNVATSTISSECEVENWADLFRASAARKFIEKPFNPETQKTHKQFVRLSFADKLRKIPKKG